MTPTVERNDFREAMSRLGAAVNIITTDGAAGLHGLTASAVCSVTDDPPTLLVCVNRASNVHAALSQNGVLCVNVLASRHQELSNLFGRGGIPVEQRFAGAEWRMLTTGAPSLADAVVSLDCAIAQTTEIGTHSVFFCSVRAIALGAQPEGLIYFNRGYHDIAPAPRDLCHQD
jgi:flavin reductase